nr:sortase [Bifidobacterium miconisargentati]
MYIPRFGSGWDRLIQQGTGDDILNNLGVAHYENSVMPGALGMTGYAGHRQSASLWLLDTVRVGDAVVIRTKDYWYVYRITGTKIVTADDWSVLDPVEGERTLVLTTCDPKYPTSEPSNRLVAFAEFDYWARASEGTVRELTGADSTPRTVGATISRVSDTVRRVNHDAPVTPSLAVLLLGSWLVLDAGCWLLDRRASIRRLRRDGWWNPMLLLWRLQAGFLPVRLVLYLLMWSGVVFTCFAWLCPWLAEHVSWLAAPHPVMG